MANWWTENAIKRKNKLYKLYSKYETSFNEKCYTQYKNRLTTILRNQEKEYYKRLMEINRKICGLSLEV